MSQAINLVNLSGIHLPKSFKKSTGRLLRRIEKISNRKIYSLDVVMVSPVRMRQLNKTYRRRDKSTDVLSFQYRNGQSLSGEIFICPQQARRQATQFKQTLLEELEFLFVHGSLHILGYDHVRVSERRAMERLEGVILNSSAG
jgi:probable rRNA maturation factor